MFICFRVCHYKMIIAVEGCAHGELDKIYDSVERLSRQRNVKVDLLICCGDFQAVRNEMDLQCMAVPDKFKDMCSFYKYKIRSVEVMKDQ